MTTTPRLAADETYVDGRGSATAQELLKLAKAAGKEGSVRTTSHGYIVPTDILPEDYEGTTLTEESRPAVHTEPGTDPDVANVYNVGQAPEFDTFAQTEEAAEEFDPSKASIDEVKEYLAGADDTERERVLAAEADGKKRKGVLELSATTPEGDK
jgi:hypothetical protein